MCSLKDTTEPVNRICDINAGYWREGRYRQIKNNHYILVSWRKKHGTDSLVCGSTSCAKLSLLTRHCFLTSQKLKSEVMLCCFLMACLNHGLLWCLNHQLWILFIQFSQLLNQDCGKETHQTCRRATICFSAMPVVA